MKRLLFIAFLLITQIAYAGNIGGQNIGSQVSFIGQPVVSGQTVTGNDVYATNLYVNGVNTNSVFLTLAAPNQTIVQVPDFSNGLTLGTMTIASGSITDSSGLIQFGNENFTQIGSISSDGGAFSTDGSGNLTTTGTISTDKFDWTGGNVIYVPLTGDIQTYINAATAGDTLVLAAGTYTITAGITVNKLLHIMGQGEGITTISCATADVTMITTSTTVGSVISDLTLSASQANTVDKPMTNLTVSTDFYNIEFINTCTGGATIDSAMIYVNTASVVINVENCTFSATGATATHMTFQNVTNAATINARNCHSSASNGTGVGNGNISVYASVGTMNLYNCYFLNTTDTTGGVVQCAGGTINVYNCEISGTGATGFDVLRSSGTLTLYNTTLVNNKTSGTITYGGTVATSNIHNDVLTASLPVFTNATKELTSNTMTGTGKVVMDTTPTIATPILTDQTYSATTTNGLINSAKLALIEDVNQIVGTANIKGFWIFDQTGAVTSVTDRSPNSHTLTLGGNASTLSPAVAGLCPNLTMNGTAATAWSVADNDDFSFGNGAGVDSAFSLVCLVSPVDVTACRLVCKAQTNQREYSLDINASDKLGILVGDLTLTNYITRYRNATVTSDEGSWHVYSGTTSGGSPQALAGLKVYRDGVRVDDTDGTGGAYAGMTNGTSTVGCQVTTTYAKAKYGIVLIVSKELTAAENLRLSNRLRAYAGSFL